MQPGLSTYVFLQQRLRPGLLDALRRSGAAIIEVVAARHHFDYTDRSAVRDLATWFHDTGTLTTLHQPLYLTDRADTQWSRHVSPNLSLIDPEKARRIDAMDEVKRALESAEQIPFRAITLHLGLKDDRWSPRSLENSLTAIEHLQAFARPLGVHLLLENLQNEVTTPEHLLEILRVGHFDTVGITLDLGHAHLPLADTAAIGIEATLDLLRPRIAQVDLSDNHGKADEHLWPIPTTSAGNLSTSNPKTATAEAPTQTSIDWTATHRLLSTLPANTPGILEIAHDLEMSPEVSPESVTARASAFFSSQSRRTEALHTQANTPT